MSTISLWNSFRKDLPKDNNTKVLLRCLLEIPQQLGGLTPDHPPKKKTQLLTYCITNQNCQLFVREIHHNPAIFPKKGSVDKSSNPMGSLALKFSWYCSTRLPNTWALEVWRGGPPKHTIQTPWKPQEVWLEDEGFMKKSCTSINEKVNIPGKVYPIIC